MRASHSATHHFDCCTAARRHGSSSRRRVAMCLVLETELDTYITSGPYSPVSAVLISFIWSLMRKNSLQKITILRLHHLMLYIHPDLPRIISRVLTIFRPSFFQYRSSSHGNFFPFVGHIHIGSLLAVSPASAQLTTNARNTVLSPTDIAWFTNRLIRAERLSGPGGRGE